ncbi:energy transducer TonB [Niabella hibiscisoli]|uniref:energy transducer TonB n=1 Tax=Niabella hibiscisoli TaxID=1825928 RepID=UPI001F0D2737|nr:energy transducer TonB [Niabella hibiscisoli]MCH5719982.1 energy transducer TonB [Niabella hibiscisoli]
MDSATINGKNDPVTGVTINPVPGSKDISSPAPETTTATVDDQPQNRNENIPEVFTNVEVDAKYPGNWRSFLEKKLNGQVAVDNGASPGNHTTVIQFIVDTKGNVSDVKALTNVGYGLEEEAIRVIKQSGKWKPAIMHGKPVKAYRKQPITFQVTEV